jgi:hypothetical protein
MFNPNSELDPQIKNRLSKDAFDMPVAGQSLTDEPRKWAWENPPQFTTVDESLIYVVEKIRNSSRAQKGYDELITLGMPIESLVNTITFGGFVEGLWTVDIAEMLKPPLMSFFMLYADEKELPFVAYNNNEDVDKTFADDMSFVDTVSTIKENNPVYFSEVRNAMNENAMMQIKKQAREEDIKNSFLVVSPEEEPIEEIKDMEGVDD